MFAEKPEAEKRLREIEAALERAAKRAEEVAKRTGTPLVLWEDGKIVEHYPSGQVPTDRQPVK